LYLDSRKDGRSQRWALANNLPADAGAGEKAVHAGRMGKAFDGVKSRIGVKTRAQTPPELQIHKRPRSLKS
jgi:hypothetical protein